MRSCDSTLSWAMIEDEYKKARFALEQLLKESGPISSGAEQLILELDKHFQHMKYRVDNSVPMSRALATPLPPPIDRHWVKGLLAYRAWKMEIRGCLSPAIMSTSDAWKNEVAFADCTPTVDNRSGLHATRLERWTNNSYGDYISGIVDLYGKVIEHADGVLRGECARIQMLMIEIKDSNQAVTMLTGVYELLRNRYPNVPVHIITSFQKQLIICREVLINQGAYVR